MDFYHIYYIDGSIEFYIYSKMFFSRNWPQSLFQYVQILQLYKARSENLPAKIQSSHLE